MPSIRVVSKSAGLDASMRSTNPLADSALLRAGLQSRLDALRVLTDVTDGRTVLNTNAPGGPDARRSCKRPRRTTCWAFNRRTRRRAGRARRIEVKVNRRGVRVQSRRGHGSPVDAPSRSASAGRPSIDLDRCGEGPPAEDGARDCCHRHAIRQCGQGGGRRDRGRGRARAAESERAGGLNRARRRERGDLHRCVRPRGP